jgi:aerobic-type carbon monoxide dehydrogenase small subunit (CoxS/CutS family)
MRFLINSKPVEADFDPRTSLLDLLRDHLGLPGSEGM